MSTLTGNDVYGLMEAYQAVYAPQELTEEQVWEEVETWVNDLIEEGYDLSDYTWEEMFEAYIDEQGRPGSAAIRNQNVYKPAPQSKPQVAGGGMDGMRGSGRDRNAYQTSSSPGALRVTPPPAKVGPKIVGPKIVGPGSTPRQQAPAAPATRTAAPAKPASAIKTTPASTTTPTPAPSSPRVKDTSITDMIGRSQLRQGAPINTGNKSSDARTIATGASVGSFQKPAAPAPARPMGSARERMLRQSFDPFDVIKGHLLDEGYADTEEAALVIMANMSEDWRESIVEAQEARNNPEKYEAEQSKKKSKKQRAMEDPYRGINSPAFAAFMKQQMGR